MTTKTFFCSECNESIEHEAPNDDVFEGIAAAVDHFRVMHPEVRIETWPDGAPVVVDDSLAPDDFGPADDEGASE